MCIQNEELCNKYEEFLIECDEICRDLTLAAAARRGIERNSQWDTAKQSIHVRYARWVAEVQPKPTPSLRRTTTAAWGGWPLRKGPKGHKGRRELYVNTVRFLY